MRGIVFDGKTAQLRTDVEMRDIGPGEVRVGIKAAGLCHSDVSVINGTIPFPPPVVLGHEGAGVVEAVGEGVTRLAVGDHVVLSTLGNCGACGPCDMGKPTHCRETAGKLKRPFTVDGTKAFQFANTAAFAESTLVPERQAVKIDSSVPLEVASLIGCGVITGVGAVINRARVEPGSRVVVIGVGGIGLNVIQGARLVGAAQIIAVDANPDKVDLAALFGATDFVLAGPDVDTVEAIKELSGGGVDYAFECVGAPFLVRQAIDSLDWGGTCVILGVPKFGSEVSVMIAGLYNDKTIMGCRYGAAHPHHDFPMIVRLYQQGKLLLDELVTRTYPVEDFAVALDDLHEGRLARGVLTF
ncbi:MAG: Zn-dependent alcohol dehydrogenase [Acidimicrobiia bacterium]|nr:Zn-dependent alcohol dehydrogenase [Acidimicrobiia bacterium]MBP8181876.1 Zn-dependent alcohol dehydrogenase [Acidimicrobiia bacterium]